MPPSGGTAVPPSGPTAGAPGPARTGRGAAVVPPLAVLAGVVAAFGWVAAVDPNEPGHYPACPLLRWTGVYCPGCGGLRSAHAVAHGDLATALHANALAVLAYAGFAAFWAVWLVRATTGRPLELRPRPVHGWSLAALALIFTAVRNTPLGRGLVP
ncbi:DUF2752 domain-containing protein [Streptomyces sp. bgisy100]|uniref:DUF2752 domain-containing protein n=1 Tax=Streptomyces sp. bgisy100 TaxID=3413783 RepID=UPI003D740684